jgi:hypothetical protein
MGRHDAGRGGGAQAWLAVSGVLPFRISAWAAWSNTAWAAWPEGNVADPARPLPASLRRRVTATGRKALEAAWTVLAHAAAEPRLVLCSRHGEYERTLSILESLAEDGTVSPADFSLSVHHALAGLLSIATTNRAGHTAIAAGPDSLGFGLLEAAAAVAEDGRPALLVYFDEPLSIIYGPLPGDVAGSIALAMLLVPEGGEAMSLEMVAAEHRGAQAQAPEFLAFLASGEPERRVAGERREWRWRRAA